MEVDICFSPALYPFYQQEKDTVVVVDIFRASTTICTMFHNGVKAVIPVSTVDEALSFKQKGFIVGGERNACKLEFADFGNSPHEYTKEAIRNKEVVFTTTNGTRAIDAAKESGLVLVGAFSNIDAIADKCIQVGNRVVILCAGWKNRVNVEDTLFGAALALKIKEQTKLHNHSDSLRMALDLWEKAKDDIYNYIKSTEHFQRLVKSNADGDIPYCLTSNITNCVPVFDTSTGKLILG